MYCFNPCKGSRRDTLNKKLSGDADPAFREIALEFETSVECGNGHIHHELAKLISFVFIAWRGDGCPPCFFVVGDDAVQVL